MSKKYVDAIDGSIRVLVKSPEEEIGHITRIRNNLKDLQKAVGGYIEAVTISPDIVILCNEEGRLDNLPYNCEIAGISFVGTIIAVGVEGEEFADLPEFVTLDYWKEELLEE